MNDTFSDLWEAEAWTGAGMTGYDLNDLDEMGNGNGMIRLNERCKTVSLPVSVMYQLKFSDGQKAEK